MPIVSRIEFASMLGITTGIVNMNVSRKKIETLPDKRIDSEAPLNVVFAKLRRQKQRKDVIVASAARKEVREVKKEKAIKVIEKEVIVYSQPIPEKPPRKKRKTESDADDDDLITRKLKADTLKAERDNELKQLQLEKMMGKLIPVDLVHGILKVNIQNIFTSFENELENIASEYCDIMADGDRSKLARVTTNMREVLHRIIGDTKNNSAKEIKGVIDEFSVVRSRGERK